MTVDCVFKILWLDKLITPENPEETNNKNNNKHQLPPQSKLMYYTSKLCYFKRTYNYRKVGEEAVTDVNANENLLVTGICPASIRFPGKTGGRGGPSLPCWEEVSGFSISAQLMQDAGHAAPGEKGAALCYCDSKKGSTRCPSGSTLALVGPPATLRRWSGFHTALSLTSQVEPTAVSISSTSGSVFVIFASVNENRTHTINLFLILWATSW